MEEKRTALGSPSSDGTLDTKCCSCVGEAFEWMKCAEAVGIDCPMWWTSAPGGGRRVDRTLRELLGNSLVQGILLAMKLREYKPDLQITETHPKALLIARNLKGAPWPTVAEGFELRGNQPSNEHERDALLSAAVARDGVRKRWCDLSLDRDPEELDPKKKWFGPVAYWWPPDLVRRSPSAVHTGSGEGK